VNGYHHYSDKVFFSVLINGQPGLLSDVSRGQGKEIPFHRIFLS